jgi:hypothetical protein
VITTSGIVRMTASSTAALPDTIFTLADLLAFSEKIITEHSGEAGGRGRLGATIRAGALQVNHTLPKAPPNVEK